MGDKFLEFLGAVVVAGGGIGVITFLLFRFFGEKWLESKFAERLADYKHRHQQELEQLRFRINSMFDRRTKLHEKEFEVLPEMWSRLNDAYWFARSFTSPLQFLSDLNRMSEPEIDELLKSSPISEWQKKAVMKEADKTKYYDDAMFWHRLGECKKAARDFHVYRLKSGIFVPEPLRAKFSEIEEAIWDAIGEKEMTKQYPDTRKLTGTKEEVLRKDAEKKLNDLQREVHERLWDSKEGAL